MALLEWNSTQSSVEFFLSAQRHKGNVSWRRETSAAYRINVSLGIFSSDIDEIDGDTHIVGFEGLISSSFIHILSLLVIPLPMNYGNAIITENFGYISNICMENPICDVLLLH